MFRVAVVNPTSVRNKACEFNSIDADVFAVSETSATSATQKQETFRLKSFGLKAVWGEAVPPSRILEDGRDSIRGSSTGVCCLSRVAIRESRSPFPAHWRATCRLLVTFIHLQTVCIRFIVAYGVPGGTPDQALKNNSLWRAIHSIIVEHDMPTIVAGDFNAPPQSCEAWGDLQSMGFSELFQLHFDLFGEWLPPTCKGVTRNDTMIVSHHLSPTYRCSEVIHDAPFRTHSPLIASFDLKKSSFHRRVFCMPEALYDDILSSDLFQHEQERLIDVCRNEVHQCLSGETTKDDISDALANVGKTFETAYSNTQRFLEKFCPLNAPPPIRNKQKGRFRERKFLEKPPRQCPPKGRNGSYEPPCEVFKTRTMQWVRQLRRLESLARALKKYANHTLPLNISRQFGCEWYAIQHAPGFRPNFGTWCQKHALVPIWYHDIPPFDWISSLIEVFRPAVDAICHAEDKAQSRVDKYAMSLDFIHFGSAMAYRKLKPPKPTSIDHLMVPHEFEGKRIRVQEKSKPVVSISHSDMLTPPLPLQIGENCISIVDVADDLVYLDELPSHVGSQFHATQYQPEFNPEALHRVFFDFWEPFWLRDSGPQIVDINAWPEFLQLARQHGFCDAPIPTHEMNLGEWKHAIKGTKSKTARGSCGLSQPEFSKFHDELLQLVVDIFQHATKCGLPGWMMLAIVALVPKTDMANSISAMRPITIFSLAFRIWAKTVTKRLLSNWSFTLPRAISGGLPRRSCVQLSLHNSIQVELAVYQGSSIGGYILDITKCFNAFPRIPVLWLLECEGLSIDEFQLWTLSMNDMSRTVQLGNSFSSPRGATTGMAEGDPIAVCGMAQVAHLWVKIMTRVGVIPSSYADNWSWFANDPKLHILALKETHAYLKMMCLSSDPSKCWAWGANKETRKMWKEISAVVVGDPEAIRVTLSEKDLGIQMRYAAMTHLGDAFARIQAGLERIRRLWHAPYTIEKKCSLVQTGVFPVMFFGAFGVYIGKKHFSKIRTVQHIVTPFWLVVFLLGALMTHLSMLLGKPFQFGINTFIVFPTNDALFMNTLQRLLIPLHQLLVLFPALSVICYILVGLLVLAVKLLTILGLDGFCTI